MKVTNIETCLLGIDRPLLSIVRVYTDEGISGIGDCTVFSADIHECSCAVPLIVDSFKTKVIGQDPFNIEKICQSILFETFWARGGGPYINAAIGAIEIALWDIIGKKLKTPIYNLLGGRCREKVKVYANRWFGNCHKPKDYAKAATKVVEDGFRALKLDPFGTKFERINSYSFKMDDVVGTLNAVRDAVGNDVDILIEMHGKLGTQSAIRFCKEFEKFDPMFCEEPIAPGNVDAMVKVARNVDVPIAAGERLYSRFEFREYLEKGALDIVQPDTSLAGGILEVSKKIASMAETYFVPIAPHLMEGPVATAAAMQVDACTPNFLIQEFVPHGAGYTTTLPDLVINSYEMGYWKNKNGFVELSTKPGLGIELNEQVFRKYLLKRVPHR